MTVQTNVAARLDREQSQSQLPACHFLNFGAQIHNRRLARSEPLVVLWSVCGNGDYSTAAKNKPG
jgi:hypothetical protein